MTSPDAVDQAALRNALDAARIQWRRHSLQRMLERNIARSEVFDVLRDGEVIEDYADDTPFPSALLLGFSKGRPLHVVVALDATGPEAYVITVYQPAPDRWEPDWKTRRQA